MKIDDKHMEECKHEETYISEVEATSPDYDELKAFWKVHICEECEVLVKAEFIGYSEID